MKNFVKLASVLFFTATAAFAQTDTTTTTTNTNTDVVVTQPTNNTVVRKRVRVNNNDVYRNDKVVHTNADVNKAAAATPRNNRLRRDRY